MKRICLIFLSSLLCLTAYASPTAYEVFDAFETGGGAFSDMEAHPWAKDAVDYLYKNSIVSGVGGGLFAPDLKVTRLEFIKMICTSAAVVDTDASADFSDVGKDSWGYIYAASAKNIGLTDIYGDDFLGADTPISREDMAYMAYRAIGLFEEIEDGSYAEFADDEEISDYAKEAVCYLREAGIINGRGENLFDPKGTATRAESAKIIYNVAVKISENYLDKEN